MYRLQQLVGRVSILDDQLFPPHSPRLCDKLIRFSRYLVFSQLVGRVSILDDQLFILCPPRRCGQFNLVFSLSRFLAFTQSLNHRLFVQTNATSQGTQFKHRSPAVNHTL